MLKYDPLQAFLTKTPTHLKNVLFSFEQIEQIIGTNL
jgi:hypothetical protein